MVMKTTENCFGIGSYASSVFFMGLFCVWTLFNPPLPVFVCFPRRLPPVFPSFTRVFKSVFFYFILHSCVSVSSAPPALFSEASCSSPVLYLSFLVLSLTLDFGFWTLDIILSKLTFCYSTCLPASVSALVTGFIASHKRISLDKWRHRLFQKTPPKQQMFYALTAATEIYNSFGRHRRNMFSRSSIRSTNWLLNVVLEVKNDPCI